MEEKEGGIAILIIIGLIIGGIYLFFGGEQEGILNDIDNCKEVIKTDDEFYNKIFTKYTCNYNKTNSGKMISGICYHPEFNNNGICMKVTTYEKKSEIKCKDPENTYVDEEGACHCEYGKNWNDSSGKCEESEGGIY